MIGGLLDRFLQLLSELKRRKVYQVALAYVVVGFMVIEAADLTLVRLGLPPWTVTFVVVLVGLGFPITLVLAWALEVTPEGVRVEETTVEETEESGDLPARARSPRDLWVGASVLVLLLFGAWWMWGGFFGGDRSGNNVSKKGAPEIEDRSVAVLPFEVSGAGAEEWRDGMVTMLSTGLDGAAGLRAIPDRTVLARWSESSEAQEGATTAEALAVARKIGARYAVIGSAGGVGEELRFSADVHEVASGERLGRALVRGSPDSVTALTDRLTRKVLGVLLEESEDSVPPVDLASITTASIPALKAFLRGERHFRAGAYEAAIEDYSEAIEHDSTFALAYVRTRTAYDWTGESPEIQNPLQQAYALSGRLPRRERRLVRTKYLYEGLAETDSLRRLAEDYPDDPRVWYELGENLWHSVPPISGGFPRGLPEAERAFERAAELDPGVAHYHFHLIHLAFILHRDSVLAARRIETLPGNPNSFFKRAYQLSLDLVFGSPARREQAFRQIDSLAMEGTGASAFEGQFRHPTDGGLHEQVLRRFRNRGNLGGDTGSVNLWLVVNSFERGQVRKALRQLREDPVDPPYESCLPAWSMSLGLPVGESSFLQERRDPSQMEEGASSYRLLCAGISLIERGRPEELGPLLARLQEDKKALRELRGYRAWTAGNLEAAERLWRDQNVSYYWGAIWRGDLYRELDELEKAEGWYLAAWVHPVAHERLGRVYEEMGRPEDAIDAYRRFIEAWKNADPELQDRVETARKRLDALGDPTTAE